MPKPGEPEPVFKQRLYALIFLLLVGSILYAFVSAAITNWNKTLEQRVAEEKAAERQNAVLRQSRQHEADVAKSKLFEDSRMCRVKAVCERFAAVRQECATAGNFENCVSVKLGDAASMIGECTNDGMVATPYPDTVPSAVECWLHGVASYVGGP